MFRGLPLAAGALGCILLAGCPRPAPAPPQNTPVSIRLDALLPLHPAWADVRELDVLIAHTAGLSSGSKPATAARAGFPLVEVPLPPPLTAGTNSLPSHPPSLEAVTRAAEVRLSRLRDSLDAHTARIVDRERKERMEKVDAEVAAKKADLQAAAAVTPVESLLSDEDRRELRRLEFQQIAYESQVAALLPPARGEAIAKLADVKKRIQAIEAKAPKPAEALQSKVQQQVDEFRKSRVAAMEQELSKRETELKAQTAARLDPYRKQLKAQIALPPAPSIQAGSSGPVRPGRIASPAEVASSMTTAAAPLPTGEAIARLKDQRARLARTISDELKARLIAVAAARHWAVSFEPRAGYIDVTDKAASALKGELESETATLGTPK